MAGEERAERCGEELAAFVALHALDGDMEGDMELRLDVGEEACDCVCGVGLVPEGKGPGVVREIIKHHEVILKTREATHGRGPEITM